MEPTTPNPGWGCLGLSCWSPFPSGPYNQAKPQRLQGRRKHKGNARKRSETLRTTNPTSFICHLGCSQGTIYTEQKVMSWKMSPLPRNILPLKTEKAVVSSTRCHLRAATKPRGCFEQVYQLPSSVVCLPQTQQMNQILPSALPLETQSCDTPASGSLLGVTSTCHQGPLVPLKCPRPPWTHLGQAAPQGCHHPT